jgi:hypothetical protein
MDKSSAPSEKFTTVSVTNTFQVSHVVNANNGVDAATPSLGFFDAAPAVQAILDTGVGATVDDVIGALQVLGLFKQSPA